MISPAYVQLFSGLQQDEVKAVEAAGTRLQFKPSQIIVTAGEPAKSLFLIRTGCVDYHITTETGQDLLLRRLRAGNVFGVAAFLSEPIGYLGTAKAVQHCHVLEWSDQVTRQLATSYPKLAENALRTVLRYLALYAKRHIALATNTAQERLACALTSLGSRTGHVVPSGLEVRIKNEDLASLADVSVFTASRIVSKWSREDLVEKRRGKIIIRSPEKLLSAEVEATPVDFESRERGQGRPASRGVHRRPLTRTAR